MSASRTALALIAALATGAALVPAAQAQSTIGTGGSSAGSTGNAVAVPGAAQPGTKGQADANKGKGTAANSSSTAGSSVGSGSSSVISSGPAPTGGSRIGNSAGHQSGTTSTRASQTHARQ